jgi:hypothetical protein
MADVALFMASDKPMTGTTVNLTTEGLQVNSG